MTEQPFRGFCALRSFFQVPPRLIFETLWFRGVGLALGNSVWASAVVLSSFMCGLGLGNALATFHGHRIRSPLLFYGIMELVIAVTGIALVIALPLLSERLSPLFSPFLAYPLILNVLRLSISFLLLVIPTTCMGMTLPLVVKSIHRRFPCFGSVLGQLYGWNTLGAVAGSLVSEMALIGPFGVIGTAKWACLLNIIAGVAAIQSFPC